MELGVAVKLGGGEKRKEKGGYCVGEVGELLPLSYYYLPSILLPNNNNNRSSVVPQTVGSRKGEIYADLTSTSMKLERLKNILISLQPPKSFQNFYYPQSNKECPKQLWPMNQGSIEGGMTGSLQSFVFHLTP